MTDLAFFLISVDRGTPAEVARRVRDLPGIRDAYATMGDYDVVAVSEMEGTRGFPAVTTAIARAQGVAKVVACVVVRAD